MIKKSIREICGNIILKKNLYFSGLCFLAVPWNSFK